MCKSFTFLIIQVFIVLNITEYDLFGFEPANRFETFCKMISLSKYEYETIDGNTILWIPLNRTIQVKYYDDLHNAIVCAPLTVFKTDDNNCWRFRLSNWAYWAFENTSIIHIDFGLKATLKHSEYTFYPETNEVDVHCIHGTFQHCLQREHIRFYLNGPTLRKFNPKSTILFGKEYGEHYFLSVKNNPTVCFVSSKDTNLLKCLKTQVHNYTIKGLHVFDHTLNKTLAPDEYEINTNGDIFTCVSEFSNNKSIDFYTPVQGWLTVIGVGISLICLFLHMVLFCIYLEFRTFPGLILMSLVVALFFGQTMFILRLVVLQNQFGCIIVGVLLHFFYLSAFFWMGAIAYDVYKTFDSNVMRRFNGINKTKRFIKYSLIIWTSAFVIVCISVMVDQLSGGNTFQSRYDWGFCWISQGNALLVFFMAPLGIVLVLNVVFFTLTSCRIFRTAKDTKLATAHRGDKKRVCIYIRLAVMMGLSWITGFLSGLTGLRFLEYIFILLNAPQGLYIFVVITCAKVQRHGLSIRNKSLRTSKVASGPNNSKKVTIP